MKISACANLINAIVDPFLIFTMGMGVSGAALATVGAEVFSAFLFMYLMLKRKLIRWSKLLKLPSWTRLKPLIKGGAALQLRNVALNLTFLAVTRVTQTLDDTGVAAAAHAMALQTFQVGGIVLLALSVVAQTMIPNEMVEKTDPITGKKSGGILATKAVVNRLMSWGFLLGGILGALQIALLPILQKSSPLIEVREAALMPSILASVYQLINGLVFIGEGVMVGCGSFFQLSVSTMVATAGTIIALNTLPKKYGLTGVWMGFGVFNTLRLLGVWIHQKYGPLARRNLPSASS
jgi:Na+-driven multidrug efflux pump